MNSALIAGGAGFVGSHLVKKLLDEDYEVTVIDSLITGFKKNIDEFFDNSNFTFIEGDVAQEISFTKKNLDIIFHLASPASPPKYFNFPQETIKANVHGTMNLLELCKKYDSRMIFASTSEIYGDPKVSPQVESYWGNVNPIGPRSVYDEAKRLGETLCAQAAREGQDIGIIRIFNTYGPKMDPFDGRVVSTFIRQGLQRTRFTVNGNGYQTRSFCYIDDLIEGITKYANSSLVQPINLGNPTEISVLDLMSKVTELLSVKLDIDFKEQLEDDPTQRKPDITIAKDLLSWAPITELEEGLPKTIDWMRKTLN